MVKYRNNVEIVADMLVITREGALKTQIMYQANLSFKLTERYLEAVLKAGLIKLNHDGRYLITEEGTLFLKKFSNYKRHASSLRKQLKRVNDEKALLDQMCLPMNLRNENCLDDDKKVDENRDKSKPPQL